MPPRPLAEDLARKKAERDKQAKTQEAFAALENPNGLTQFVNAVKDPVGTVKQLGRVAKETFYDPSKRFAAAVDPNSGASLPQRAAGLAESALYAADFLTPVPEQAIYREAMEKALDREVASYAASGRNAINHRTVLGIHGSPTEGLTQIAPNSRSFWSKSPEAWFWNPADNNFNVSKIADEVTRYAGPDGQVYFGRFPKSESQYSWTVQSGGQNPPAAWYSQAPGDVVGSVPSFWEKHRTTPGSGALNLNKVDAFKDSEYADNFVKALESSMTPAERRAFGQKQPDLVKRLADYRAWNESGYNFTKRPRQRYTEEEMYALRPRPTLRQLQNPALTVPLDTM
jgi:hypothetical protein